MAAETLGSAARNAGSTTAGYFASSCSNRGQDGLGKSDGEGLGLESRGMQSKTLNRKHRVAQS